MGRSISRMAGGRGRRRSIRGGAETATGGAGAHGAVRGVDGAADRPEGHQPWDVPGVPRQGRPRVFNAHSSAWEYQATLFEALGLADSRHTLRIVVETDKITVDAIEAAALSS